MTMKIDISRKDLFVLRGLIHAALTQDAYNQCPSYQSNPERLVVAGKTIRKLNQMITKIYGHDCNGQHYLKVWQPKGRPEITL